MFVASVALYLTIRKASLVKIPGYLTNLAMFGIPLLVYAGIGLSGSYSYSLTLGQVGVIIVASTVFAYTANKLSLKAIAIAPNPGYSLVLSKSYVLFTTLVAVTLLNADLTAVKALAIFLIVAFSAVIMVNPKDTKKTVAKGDNWVLLSLAAFFGWGMLSLSSKYLFSHGVETIPFLIYLYAIVTVCIISFDKVHIGKLKGISRRDWLLLIGVGIFSTLFNLGQFEAINLAPNVGYVNAINAGSIAAVTLSAMLVFKDELTPKKAIGIAGVTAGLLLLLL